MSEHPKADRLAAHMWRHALPGVPPEPWAIASRIIIEPQAHIDALVEAGVLELAMVRSGVTLGGDKAHVLVDGDYVYRVVQPHEHEWYVAEFPDGCNGDDVRLRCLAAQCPASRVVPNRLPIEVPA